MLLLDASSSRSAIPEAGCTFSSAIASNLALGFPIHKAVERAKAYTNTAITHAPELGKGNGTTHHFYELYKACFKEGE